MFQFDRESPMITDLADRKRDDPDGSMCLWASKGKPYKFGDNKELRTLFKHDGDEIIYSSAFRRLSDKSQVVVKPERTDHFRSRLTHTLEVNQIAQSIGNQLKLNIPLINAIALGHDLGHAPFGHAGERQFQEIMRSDILPLCDPGKLRRNLQNRYGTNITFKQTGECENRHWLFHHAVNSVRIIQRKLDDISQDVIDGILKHSWSPWQEKNKFGVPTSYEGQVVAIADQVAGINHDTEDILTCKEAMYSRDKIHKELLEYMTNNQIMEYGLAESILDNWFMKRNDEPDDSKGYGRKFRLREIINDVVNETMEMFKERNVDSSDCAEANSLCLSKNIRDFLSGYEKYIRSEIVGKISWFKQRDAQAAAGIWSVYNFFKHYRSQRENIQNIRPSSIHNEIEDSIKQFEKSVSSDLYSKDAHYSIFLESANPGKEGEIKEIFQVIDYVSGMTDHYLMSKYDLAFKLFRS
jgi:dGTP triphosphohydrolase